MANITVDIQAKVVGYEQSIKALQAALAKIDPGSELGKSITKAMEQAQSQVKALSKNMFPKASSDTQIDSIIEKTNRAGEAIQNVAALLQSVQVGDLNLGAFGGDIENFRNQISSLETELNTKLNQGILNTVNSSDQLKSIFQQLGTDLTKADASTLFKDLQRGASEAAKEVATAEAALKKIQDKQRNNEFASNQLQGSLLYTEEGRKSLDTELNNIMNSHGNNFTAIRDKMAESMSKLNLADGGQKLLDNFFKDLTPDNIKKKIEDLYKELQTNFGSKPDFYKAIFGEGTTNIRNNTQVAKMFDFSQDTDQIKSQFRAFLEKIKNEIKPDRAFEIKRLIDKGQLEQAAEMTEKDLDAAYGKVQTRKKKLAEETAMNTQQEAVAQQQLTTAQTNKSNIDAANTQLTQQIEQLRQQNESLQQQINSLREQLGQKLGAAVGDIRNTGATENRNMGQGFEKSLEMSQAYKEQLAQVAAKEQALGKLQGVVQRWFSIYAAIRMVRQAINSIISTVKELDATITEIAIVTSMDQSELWDQMPKYTQLARDYAASISGVYQVSQLYYQQGLQTADVMALTEQTLKMARISGLDYAQATDYMTNAVRSFKMEMTDAQTVVDVYSAIAASSATSVTELASAMSKTASSAQAVGSSFENTTAMMAVMIEATRESAENIGSAMKSIISRYGEMTSDPSKLVDSEGQEMSLNRVDKALQTVGISIHNAAGEFRNFDDVIMELAQKWDTIDTNTQRYIATIMAGNRQQSRFLALVSSYDRLKELSAEAAGSEDASQLQFLKTLDSVEAKTQQLQTSIQALYVNSGLEDFYKRILDVGNRIMTTFDQLSEKNGLISVVGKIGGTFTSLATLVTTVFTAIKAHYSMNRQAMLAEAEYSVAQEIADEQEKATKLGMIYDATTQSYIEAKEKEVAAAQDAAEQKLEIARQENNKQQALKRTTTPQQKMARGGILASTLGLAATSYAASLDINQSRGLKAGMTGVGGALSGLGTTLMMWSTMGPGIAIAAGALSALPSIIEAIGMRTETTSEKLERLSKNIENANNTKLEAKSNLQTLESYKEKYDELNEKQYQSEEAKQEFIKIQNEIAASYPELIKGMTQEGNYVVDMTTAYEQLAAAKRKAYSEAFSADLGAEIQGLSDIHYVMKNIYGVNPFKDGGILSTNTYGKYDQFIYDQIQGSTDKTISSHWGDSLNTNDYFQTFFNGRENFQKLMEDRGTSRGYTGYSSKAFEPTNTNAKQTVNQIWDLFLESAQKGLSFAEAQNNLNASLINGQIAFNENPNVYNIGTSKNDYVNLASSAIEGFDQEIYSHMITIAKATEFQKDLIHNKIKSSNEEYVNILKNSAASAMNTESNELQNYAASLDLTEGLENYIKENENRIGALEWDATEGKSIRINEDKLISEYYADKDEQWYNAFIEAHQKDLNDTANNIYKNLGSYSASEIERQDINDNARTLLLKALNEEYGKISERYSNWIQNLDINDSDIKTALDSYQNDFGPAFLQSIQNQYEKILSNTALDNDTKAIQLSNLTSIYDVIQDIQNQDFSAGTTLLQAMQSADLTSLTGINNLIDLIQSLDIDFDTSGLIGLIQSFSSNLVVNFETEFQTYTEEIINKSKEFEKTFSKLTKGISFDEMLTTVNELGVGIEDFDNINGKYYLKNLSILKDKYKLSDQAFEQNINNRITAYNELSDTVYEEISEGISVNFDKHLNSLLPQDLREKLLKATNFEEYNEVLEEIQEYADSSEESSVNYADIIDLIQVDELKSESQASLNDLINNAKNFTEVETYLNEHVQDSWFIDQGLSRTQIYNEIRGFMNSESYGKMTFLDYVKNVLPEQWNAIQQATNDYYEDMFAQNLLVAGDIEGFIETAAKKSITNTVKSEAAFKNATVEEINNEVIKRYEELLQNNPQLQSQIISGDVNNLPVELQKYAALIYDTFRSARESIINSLIASVGGNGSNLIKVTDTNKKILEDLQGKGWITGDIISGNYVTIAAENLLDSAQTFEQQIVSSFATNAERIKALTDFHNNQYKNSSIGSFDKVLTTENFAYEDLLNYLVNTKNIDLTEHVADIPTYMNAMGLAFNSVGEVIVTNYETWIKELEWTANILKNDPNASQKEQNSIQAKLASARHAQEQAIASGFDGILKNYSNISTEAIEALANSLGMSFDEVLTYLTPNGDGSYRLDMTKTQDLIAKARGKVSEATLQAINQSVGNIADEYSKSLEDVRSYMKSGTTSRADMEKFVQQYNQLTDESINADQAFTYNSTKKKWTLSGDYVIKYAQKRAEQLQLVDDEYNQYINDLLSADVGESIISAIDAIGTQQFEDSQKDLLASLTTYYTNKYQSEIPAEAIPSDEALQEASTQVIDAGVQALGAAIGGVGQYLDDMFGQKSGSIADQIGRKQVIAGAKPMSRFGGFYTNSSPFENLLTSVGTLASTAMSSVTTAIDPALKAAETFTTILKGGSPAVEAYKTINSHATQEELEKIFYSQMNILNSAISDVDQLVAGQFVGTEGKLYEILKQAGAIDADADGVVAAGFSMVSVYTQIYTEMYNTLGHTNADLNNIYAKLLAEEDKQQITLKDALSNAGGMSYEAFAQLMNTYNLDMRKVMDNQALAGNLVRDGFGNIVITNFKAFSEYMKSNGADWDFTSSEIKAAYSSYVDAKTELLNQDKKDMQSLADQISGLTEAKPDTAINVSYIEDALGTEALNEIATRFNAALHDGILTITDYTDIPGLINEIARQAENADKLLPEQLAALADAVSSMLSNITSLIKNGISGKLNNVDAQSLLSWYRKYTGNQEAQLQFTNTAEGLKLSNRSARELYTTMRQVDALQADIVFDELKKSLIESEDHFKTIQSTAAYIDALRKGTAYPDNSERIADLNEELALAEKINQERSTTEDDSFKFMEGKIPAGQNNPLNYWQNWAEAFKTIKASMKGNKKSKNTMAYEDFYNIVTEMGNLTKLTGQAVQYGDVLVDDSANAAEKSVTAAELIESAAGALKNVDGKLVVDLSKIGVDLNMSGLKGLGKQLDSQVDAVADSQIEMLESIAKLLEVIVAMENLKDIDVDFDGEIDLSELFSDWEIKGADATEFTTNAQEAAKKILNQADALGEGSPLYEALEAVRINGKTIRGLLTDVANNTKDTKISAEQYQAALNALYQAMMSNDYDLDNIGESLFNILSEAGLDSVAIDVGEKTYYLTGNTRYVVDWNDEDAVKAATEALKAADAWTDSKDAKSNIQDAIDKLNNEDIELTKEEKVNLEYAISIATGSISIKQNKDKKTQKKGQYVGNYKGQTFYSDDKEQLENVVKKALGLEEEGFTVKINEDANIDATYKQGRTNIKYDPNAKEKKYIVEGEYGGEYSTLREAINDQVSKGFANQSDIGTYNIGGTSFEVAYSAQLQAAYSIEHNANGDKYHYNGQWFSSYNDLIAYISATNLTKNENKWSKTGGKDTEKKVETFTYKNNKQIKIEIDYNGATPKVTYKYGDKTVTDDPKNIAKLLEISDLVDASKEKGGQMNLNGSEMTATFVYDGMLINVEANVESGTFIYKFHDPQTGTNIEASSLSALKSAVAAILGKKSSQSGDDSGTITVNNVTFNYKMNAEGHIEVKLANKDQLTEETQKQAAQLAEQLNLDKGSTSGTKEPVNITATSVNVTLADGASVTLNGELTNDQKTIKDLPPMKGEVSELELTMANNATITLDTQGKDLELKDAVKAEGDIEELTLNINSEGEVSTVELAETPAILSDAVDAEGTVNTLTLSTTGESIIQMSESSVEIRPKPIPEATGEVTNLEITNSANTEVTGYAEPKPIPSMSAKVTTLQLSADNVEIDIGSDGNEVENLEAKATITTTSDVAEQVATDKALLNSLASEISNPTISTTSDVAGVVSAAESALARINGKSAHTYVYTHYVTTGGGDGTISETSPQVPDGNGGYINATGNIGLAKSKGTLMGELGPELVVSNGRYFVAGQNGAEMVNLADDAIVFNHLQTEQLLKNGMSSSRGRAVTNERNAVAFATGNINGGPAMASASAALAAIRQLINMWKSLKDANVSDLAGAGGGGGGGGGDKAKIVDPKAWVDTVERWYNLTQEIARLEEEITHQETIRSKLQSDWQKNGNAYYRSQKKSLDSLNQQIAAQEQLNISRREYFNKRVEALKDEALGQIYTFDEEGQLQFRKDVTINGKQGGMEFLTDLYGFNNLGKANYTNKEKYDILMASGFADYMKYDSNGMEIKVGGEGKEEDYETFYEQATQAFRDRLDQYNEATQSLLDEINKGEDDIEKLETDRNELMKEIRDNQMELENEILDAIVETRQRQIDALQDQRDALEETTGKYIEGLSDALEKERDMYERQESQDELNRNKRRLAILQRSGGSAADISSLQNDISSQERDLYFDAQQAQIDAIQEASDLEIERLDKQIELMTETLEFQQEYGLLWGEVYEVMDRSSQEIVDFINGNSAEFWKMSTLAQVQAMNDETFKAEYWTSYKDDLDVMATEIREAQLARDYAIFDERMKAEYGDNYDANGRYRQAFENEYRQGWNIDEATEVARKLYHDEVIKPQEEARRAAERAAAEAAAQAAVEQIASGGGGGDSNSCGGTCSGICKDGCGGRCGATCQQKCKGNTQSSAPATCAGCRAGCYGGCGGLTKGYSSKASGGYVSHGLYELGELGTETVLTASQTRVLRNNILSNRPNSLISLLKTYNEGFSQNNFAKAASQLHTEVTDSGITIENATVNMNVQQISNDYDARRAGEQALNEIMRIARKSGATNSVRR